jgi:hypothetical protein
LFFGHGNAVDNAAVVKTASPKFRVWGLSSRYFTTTRAEVYLTAEGKAFDATGVPPDISVNFFLVEDLHEGRDAAIEAAQKVLVSRLATGRVAYR